MRRSASSIAWRRRCASVERRRRAAGQSGERVPYSARAAFHATLVGVVALRIVLAVLLPITGDEAYFFYWGQTPDWGFYDHPPMIGWWLAAMRLFGDSALATRLVSVLLPIVVAYVVVALARPAGSERAYLAGLAVLLIPAEWLNVLVSTDTPLVFFSVLSVLAYARALRESGLANRWHVAAGVLLGGALLSKYFAVLLAAGYLAFVIASPAKERRWTGLAVAYACAAPLTLIMLWWNADHCWTNVMFNVYNRHSTARVGWATPLLYIGTLLYVTSPLVWWQLARSGRVGLALAAYPERRLLFWAAALPFAIFAVLSIAKTIGLHWLFAFAPLVFALAAHVLERTQLVANIKFLAVLSLVHLVGLVVVSILPIETWARSKIYDGLVLTVKPQALLRELEPYKADFFWTTDGYSNAVTLGYNARRYMGVFGEASTHARHDDILTDYSKHAGGNILVLRKSPPPAGEYERYFESVEHRAFTVHGATYHITLGRGFRYPVYRDIVLTTIRDKYYWIPAFLPQRACYFCERYFGATSCPTR